MCPCLANISPSSSSRVGPLVQPSLVFCSCSLSQVLRKLLRLLPGIFCGHVRCCFGWVPVHVIPMLPALQLGGRQLSLWAHRAFCWAWQPAQSQSNFRRCLTSCTSTCQSMRQFECSLSDNTWNPTGFVWVATPSRTATVSVAHERCAPRALLPCWGWLPSLALWTGMQRPRRMTSVAVGSCDRGVILPISGFLRHMGALYIAAGRYCKHSVCHDLQDFSAHGAAFCGWFSRKQTVYDGTTTEYLLVGLLWADDSFNIMIINPQEPNPQVLSICLIIDGLLSAEALRDSDARHSEILQVICLTWSPTKHMSCPGASCALPFRCNSSSYMNSQEVLEQLSPSANNMSSLKLIQNCCAPATLALFPCKDISRVGGMWKTRNLLLISTSYAAAFYSLNQLPESKARCQTFQA